MVLPLSPSSAAAASSSRASDASTLRRQDIKQVKAVVKEFVKDGKRGKERTRNTMAPHKQQPFTHEKLGENELRTTSKTIPLKPASQRLSIAHQKLFHRTPHPHPHPDKPSVAAEKIPFQDGVIEPRLVENKKNHPCSNNSSSNAHYYSLCAKRIPGVVFLLCAVIGVGTVCGSGLCREHQPDLNHAPVHEPDIVNSNVRVRHYEDKRLKYTNDAPKAMHSKPASHEQNQLLRVPREKIGDRALRGDKPPSFVKYIPAGVFLLLGAAVVSVGIVCGSSLCKEHQPHFHNAAVHQYEGARLANANDILVVPKRNLTDNSMLPFDTTMLKDMDTNDVTYFSTVFDDGIIELN